MTTATSSKGKQGETDTPKENKERPILPTFPLSKDFSPHNTKAILTRCLGSLGTQIFHGSYRQPTMKIFARQSLGQATLTMERLDTLNWRHNFLVNLIPSNSSPPNSTIPVMLSLWKDALFFNTIQPKRLLEVTLSLALTWRITVSLAASFTRIAGVATARVAD